MGLTTLGIIHTLIGIAATVFGRLSRHKTRASG